MSQRLLTIGPFVLSLLFLSGMSSCKDAALESAMASSQVVIYETQILDVEKNIEWMAHVDHRALVSDLFERIEHGSLAAYFPYDDPGEKSALTWDAILRAMDAVNDTIMFQHPETGDFSEEIVEKRLELSSIKALVFIEEWFISPTNGAIVKEVLGIAPVRFEYYGEQVHKSIVFVTYYGEKRPPLFESNY